MAGLITGNTAGITRTTGERGKNRKISRLFRERVMRLHKIKRKYWMKGGDDTSGVQKSRGVTKKRVKKPNTVVDLPNQTIRQRTKEG